MVARMATITVQEQCAALASSTSVTCVVWDDAHGEPRGFRAVSITGDMAKLARHPLEGRRFRLERAEKTGRSEGRQVWERKCWVRWEGGRLVSEDEVAGRAFADALAELTLALAGRLALLEKLSAQVA